MHWNNRSWGLLHARSCQRWGWRGSRVCGAYAIWGTHLGHPIMQTELGGSPLPSARAWPQLGWVCLAPVSYCRHLPIQASPSGMPMSPCSAPSTEATSAACGEIIRGRKRRTKTGRRRRGGTPPADPQEMTGELSSAQEQCQTSDEGGGSRGLVYRACLSSASPRTCCTRKWSFLFLRCDPRQA